MSSKPPSRTSRLTNLDPFVVADQKKREREEATRAKNAPDADSVPDAETTSHAKTVSDAKPRLEPVRKVSDAEIVSRADSAPVRGHLRVPNEILYNILPALKPSEAVVLLRLYALSHGFQKTTCTVSLEKLARGCSLSKTQTRVCVRSLESRGYIRSRGTDNVNSQKELRGLHFEVNLPSATRADSASHAKSASHAENAPYKYNNYKETNKREIEITTCEKCKDTGGFIYPNGMGGGGVIKCKHE